MEDKAKNIQHFEEFATRRLNNHIAELNTRYQNKKIDKQTLQEAYQAHQKIFDTELDEKIKSFLSAESKSGLKEELENIKNTYRSKLNLNNQ